MNLPTATQQPRRSATYSSWIALLLLIVVGILLFCSPMLLRSGLRTLLWLEKPLSGVTITTEGLQVRLHHPLYAEKVTVSAGDDPYQTNLALTKVSISLNSFWRILFGDHQWIAMAHAKAIQGLIDLRGLSSPSPSSWSVQKRLIAPSLDHFFQHLAPGSLSLNDTSLMVMGEDQRYTIKHGYCALPEHGTGFLGYHDLLIEAGPVSSKCMATEAKASWSHDRSGSQRTIRLENFFLSKSIFIDHLNILPRGDLLDVSFLAHPFGGTLRADGNITYHQGTPHLDIAFLGENLPLKQSCSFLGINENLSGSLREGRLIFRGSTLDLLHAEASINLTLDQFQWHHYGWGEITLVGNLVNQHLSLPYLLLQQSPSYLKASGEITLQEAWSKMAETPFSLELQGEIPEASQLADLLGITSPQLHGAISLEGNIQGEKKKAEGFLNIHGKKLSLAKLPMDQLEMQLQFQGEETALKKLTINSQDDHLTSHGIIENAWPHHYQVDSSYSGSLLTHNLGKDSSPLLAPLQALQPLKGSKLSLEWHGEGSDQADQGNLQLHWKNDQHNQTGYCMAYYQPGMIQIPQFILHHCSSRLAMRLLLTDETLAANHISLTHYGHSQLQGDLTLPFSGKKLLEMLSTTPAEGSPPLSLSQKLATTFVAKTPLQLKLKLNYLKPKLLEQLLFADLSDSSLNSSNQEKAIPSNTSLTGTIESSGTPEAPNIVLQLHGQHILPQLWNTTTSGSSSSNKTEASNLETKLKIQKGYGSLFLSLDNTEDPPFKVEGKLPLGLYQESEKTESNTIPSLSYIQGNAPLSLKLSFPRINLYPLRKFPLLEQLPENLLQQASSKGTISINGKMSHPQLQGYLSYKKPILRLINGISLKELEGDFLFQQQQAELTHGRATMGKGKITITGASSLSEKNQLNHNYQLQGENLLLYQNKLNQARGKANLYLQGNQEIGTLSGNITFQQLLWKNQINLFPYTIPPAMSLGVSEKSWYPNCLQELPHSSWDINLNFNYQDPFKETKTPSFSPFSSIDLALQGKLENPIPKGSITLNNLTLTTPQTELLTTGEISFSTETPWFAQMDLTGYLSPSFSTKKNHYLRAIGLEQATDQKPEISSLTPLTSFTSMRLLDTPSDSTLSPTFSPTLSCYENENSIFYEAHHQLALELAKPRNFESFLKPAIESSTQPSAEISEKDSSQRLSNWWQLYLYSLFAYPATTDSVEEQPLMQTVDSFSILP